MHYLIEEVLNNWPEKLKLDYSYTIALSGGIDSVVLLNILVNIKKIKPLIFNAIHINHNISQNSNDWEKFCKNLCIKLNVPLFTNHYTIIKSGGESLENKARNARYNSFKKLDSQVIILAHHQNDQIETMLSQIFRGSNLHNIAAMQNLSSKQNKTFWRPLLNISRQEIEAYASEHDLPYINDESNFDTKYLRNFVRHDVLPILKRWDKDITRKLLNVNSQLQNALELIDEVSKLDLAFTTNNSEIINLEKFKTISFSRQCNLISYFITNNNIPLPSEKMIKEFTRQAIQSSWDKSPKLLLTNNSNLIKQKNDIYIKNSE